MMEFYTKNCAVFEEFIKDWPVSPTAVDEVAADAATVVVDGNVVCIEVIVSVEEQLSDKIDKGVKVCSENSVVSFDNGSDITHNESNECYEKSGQEKKQTCAGDVCNRCAR